MRGIPSNRKWIIYGVTAIAGALVIVLLAAFYIRVDSSQLPPQTGAPPVFAGGLSIQERIVMSDVIARIRFRSVSASAELFDPNSIGDGRTDTFYVGALEYEFEVLEYLKGTGDRHITVIVHGWGTVGKHETREGAVRQGEEFLATRDTRWDDREAIVFLESYHPVIPSTQQAGRYRLGGIDYFGDTYTIRSQYSKEWLPAVSVGGVSGSSGDGGQRFLLDVPSSISAGVSGASEQTPSATLAELKGHIADVESDIAAGDGSEEYRQCLILGYEWQRLEDFTGGIWDKRRYDHNIDSGSPTGIFVYEDWRTYHTREMSLKYPDEPHPRYWLEGRDPHLFYAEHPGVVYTARPLPAGEYQMYYQVQGHRFIICDAYPEPQRTRYNHVVHIAAPDGTLHEAFFDPVDIGTAVGADSANGVLTPASFSNGDGDTTIQRLDWESGRVRMRLDPPSALTDHHIDFIALDGSVSLRLDFDDAVSVSDGDAGDVLTWGVCEQPWQSGDLLMLRISRSESGFADTTNDADCASMPEATPTPTPEPIPTATPTSEATPVPMALMAQSGIRLTNCCAKNYLYG